jgi:hypothetical protein
MISSGGIVRGETTADGVLFAVLGMGGDAVDADNNRLGHFFRDHYSAQATMFNLIGHITMKL